MDDIAGLRGVDKEERLQAGHRAVGGLAAVEVVAHRCRENVIIERTVVDVVPVAVVNHEERIRQSDDGSRRLARNPDEGLGPVGGGLRDPGHGGHPARVDYDIGGNRNEALPGVEGGLNVKAGIRGEQAADPYNLDGVDLRVVHLGEEGKGKLPGRTNRQDHLLDNGLLRATGGCPDDIVLNDHVSVGKDVHRPGIGPVDEGEMEPQLVLAGIKVEDGFDAVAGAEIGDQVIVVGGLWSRVDDAAGIDGNDPRPLEAAGLTGQRGPATEVGTTGIEPGDGLFLEEAGGVEADFRRGVLLGLGEEGRVKDGDRPRGAGGGLGSVAVGARIEAAAGRRRLGTVIPFRITGIDARGTGLEVVIAGGRIDELGLCEERVLIQRGVVVPLRLVAKGEVAPDERNGAALDIPDIVVGIKPGLAVEGDIDGGGSGGGDDVVAEEDVPGIHHDNSRRFRTGLDEGIVVDLRRPDGVLQQQGKIAVPVGEVVVHDAAELAVAAEVVGVEAAGVAVGDIANDLGGVVEAVPVVAVVVGDVVHYPGEAARHHPDALGIVMDDVPVGLGILSIKEDTDRVSVDLDIIEGGCPAEDIDADTVVENDAASDHRITAGEADGLGPGIEYRVVAQEGVVDPAVRANAVEAAGNHIPLDEVIHFNIWCGAGYVETVEVVVYEYVVADNPDVAPVVEAGILRIHVVGPVALEVVVFREEIEVVGANGDTRLLVEEEAVVADGQVLGIAVGGIDANVGICKGDDRDGDSICSLELDGVGPVGLVVAVKDGHRGSVVRVVRPEDGDAGLGARKDDVPGQVVGAGVDVDGVAGQRAVDGEERLEASHGRTGALAAVGVVPDGGGVDVVGGGPVVDVVLVAVVGDKEELGKARDGGHFRTGHDELRCPATGLREGRPLDGSDAARIDHHSAGQ